jgi:ATP-dependent helicase/nuclease subunit B
LNRPVFLGPDAPLPSQVAAHLLSGSPGQPPDLTDTLVIVPTTGAARAIRHQLATQSGSGVLSPQFRLPIDAVLPEATNLATRCEREVAWCKVLQHSPRSSYAALIPAAVKLEAPDDLLGAAERLVALCDLLAEAALDPSSPLLIEVCQSDAQRWSELSKLHSGYHEILAAAGLLDPNQARLTQARLPLLDPPPRRAFVACVPDLPLLTQMFLEALAARGTEVTALAWQPSDDAAMLDPWGRPDPEWWNTHRLEIPDQCLVSAHDTRDETDQLLDFVASRGAGDFALIAAAPESIGSLEAGIIRRQRLAYSPAGQSLARTEPASIVTGWESFLRTGQLRDLRPLLQLPPFADLLVAGAKNLTSSDAVEACDLLLAEHLCETAEAARDWIKNAPPVAKKPEQRQRAIITGFLAALEAMPRRHPDPRRLLAALYDSRSEPDEPRAAALEFLVETLGEIETSPLLGAQPESFREAVLRRALAVRTVFMPAPDDACEIQGWLEAPWTGASVLAVSGCREGALPAGTTEDAFLPDGARARLRLSSQASRLARDAYLLSALLARHGPENLRLGTSRFRPGGEPNRPSRLLFGCSDEELPARVTKLFDPPAQLRRPAPVTPLRLILPAPSPVTSLRVTGFKHYLACPLRFYLSQVLHLQSFDPEAREINAADFGTLVHRVLENFHKNGPHHETDEARIAGYFRDELDREVARHYGRHPAPVVRVQIEAMRVRLRQLALLQAAERRDGWRIIESEYAVKKEDGLAIGPLTLTGTMDRVEVHEEKGLRILDYKTFAKARSPEETHFGPARESHHLPEASIARPSKNGALREKSWTDLQLPLYRRLAAQIWPDHAAKGLAAGYILLPADPDDTQISLLSLDEAAQSHAETCAVAIAGRVARGIFWPPAPAAEIRYDDFADWFNGADPSEIFDEATIAHLEGSR